MFLFYSYLVKGLVYDCGYSKTQSVPVYEGYAIPHATNTAELAGHELSTCLSRMLRDRGVSMETLAELDVVQDIKEKLCYVVVDYDSERKAYNTGERNDTTYTVSIYIARVTASLLQACYLAVVKPISGCIRIA